MRQLSDKEKELNNKAMERIKEDLEIQKMIKHVLDAEVQLIYFKSKIAEYNKKKDLKEMSKYVDHLEIQVRTLKDQIEKGVEEKNG